MKNLLKISIFAILIIGVVMMSGCTNTRSTNMSSVATASITTTTQIQYPLTTTVELTTVTPAATPTISDAMKENYAMDTKFLNFMLDEGILNSINVIEMSAINGACDITFAMNLNKKLVDGPKPGSPKLQKYRSMLMDSIGHIDGTSNDLSQLKDNLAEASKILAEYNSDLDVALGVTPTVTPPIDIEWVLKKSNGFNIMEITNKMKDKRSFTVKFDVYNGKIKTSNEEQTTPVLLPGETGQVTLYCRYSCTGVTVTGIETFNETSRNVEDATSIEKPEI